jgi:hypothetical protein
MELPGRVVFNYSRVHFPKGPESVWGQTAHFRFRYLRSIVFPYTYYVLDLVMADLAWKWHGNLDFNPV